MKLQTIGLVVFMAVLVFRYEPVRPPALDPDTVPFNYDPNLCLSEPLAYAVIPAGATHEGDFKVTEPEGRPVTIYIIPDRNIVIEPRPYFKRYDPNDPLAISRIYRYHWRWKTTRNDIGLHYVNIRAEDPEGAYDERTFLILVREPEPPAGIIGCRRR